MGGDTWFRSGGRNRNAARRERWTFGAVVAVVLGGLLVTLSMASEDDPDVALAAHSQAERESATARAEVAPQDVPVEAFEAPVRVVSSLREELRSVEHHDERIEGWVRDLLDDGIRGNGMKAMWNLLRLPPGEIPALQSALTSYDEQQRHFAAAVLRRRLDRDGGTPSPALLQVCVDALRRDLRLDCAATIAHAPAASSLRFLGPHAPAAHTMLLRALESDDRQQRFFSAFLLARARVLERAQRVAYVLAEHLRDNHISGDALLATNGLYRLGEVALPVLGEARRYGDEQARELIDLILLDLRDPPRNKRELRARRKLHNVTSLYHDPAIEFDPRRSSVPRLPR